MYLIDSDIVIYHLNGRPQVQAFLLGLLNSPVFLSAVTYMEVEEGIALSSNVAVAAHRWQQVQGATMLVPFDQAEAHRAAGIRRQIKAQGSECSIPSARHHDRRDGARTWLDTCHQQPC